MRREGRQEQDDQRDDRVRNEHREVCAFLLHMLLDMKGISEGKPLVWVDLGCGEGRILKAVARGIPMDLQGRLRYVGCDTNGPAVAEATEEIGTVGLHPSSGCEHGDISDICGRLGDTRAHLITLTNVVHEIPPHRVPEVLLDCSSILDPRGYLLAYDVERLAEVDAWDEWYEVTWQWSAIAAVVEATLGRRHGRAQPRVSRWQHYSTIGWTLTVPGRDVPAPAGEERGALLASAAESVKRELGAMLDDVRAELGTLEELVNRLPGPKRGCATEESVVQRLRDSSFLTCRASRPHRVRATGLREEPGLKSWSRRPNPEPRAGARGDLVGAKNMRERRVRGITREPDCRGSS